MTDRGTESALIAATERVARTLATALGLGDDAQGTDEWPVEDGDTVLRAHVTGDATGTIVLAVNSDVATRLLAASDALAGAVGAAADQLAADLGLTLEVEAAQLAEPERPSNIAAILDGGNLTALAGVTLALPAATAAPDDPSELMDGGVAAQFEPAAFDQNDWQPAAGSGALSLLGGVEMLVTAELGRTKMAMRELLGLTPGMVVEIDRAAGSPIDLLVNGRRIATGEVVVIDEEFGIRITEIAPVMEHSR